MRLRLLAAGLSCLALVYVAHADEKGARKKGKTFRGRDLNKRDFTIATIAAPAGLKSEEGEAAAAEAAPAAKA